MKSSYSVIIQSHNGAQLHMDGNIRLQTEAQTTHAGGQFTKLYQ